MSTVHSNFKKFMCRRGLSESFGGGPCPKAPSVMPSLVDYKNVLALYAQYLVALGYFSYFDLQVAKSA